MVIATGWLERLAYRKADKVVSLLPKTLEHMRCVGLEPAKWHHIPNGIEPQVADKAPLEHPSCRLAKKWREAGEFVVIYAGALGRANNVQSLIFAVKEYKRSNSKIKVLILGRGEFQEQLRGLVSELGLQDDVAMFEQIPKSDAQKLLEVCNAGYISLKSAPILKYGISPNKLFDYMAAGLPVIFAVQSGNNIVAEADCGVSADPSDASDIARALRKIVDMEAYERGILGKNGKDYVLEKHSYAALARKYADIIESP
jgi:glycosyltransferase involved in cell wall biosynthesis